MSFENHEESGYTSVCVWHISYDIQLQNQNKLSIDMYIQF